ncbi:hypothetical protein [Aurantimonas coralicida]|uniref:hypothetical protein n=1 Tax=Aurantimonas coralicida TaxID=182270 RepID=UPI001D19391B|nr:hypothetical protein [Aurantimonas coralicida]MCC4298240.1 hypothetical protein [Aurantimonas coralicida]
MASAIEQSVRRALQKGNAADPDFRLVVYEAAERAILRVQSAQHSDEAEADRKRQALISAIEAIEAEYPAPGGYGDDAVSENGDALASAEPDVAAPATPPRPAETPEAMPATADDTQAADTPDTAAPAASTTRVAEAAPAAKAPSAKTPSAKAPAAKVDAKAATAKPGAATPTKPVRDRWSPDHKPKRGRPFSEASNKLVGAVIVVLLLLLIAAAVWVVLPLFSTTPAPVASEDGPTIAETIQSAGEDPALTGGPSPDNWIDVFAGTDLEKIAAEGGARASGVAGSGGRMAVQIAAPADGDGSEVSLVIGAGIVEQIAGSRARGELAVGSPDDQGREFSVSCLFAGETVCGRQRFQVSAAEETFVFDMAVPEGAMGAAQLVIDPQIGTGAGDLNVYGFRVQAID